MALNAPFPPIPGSHAANTWYLDVESGLSLPSFTVYNIAHTAGKRFFKCGRAIEFYTRAEELALCCATCGELGPGTSKLPPDPPVTGFPRLTHVGLDGEQLPELTPAQLRCGAKPLEACSRAYHNPSYPFRYGGTGQEPETHGLPLSTDLRTIRSSSLREAPSVRQQDQRPDDILEPDFNEQARINSFLRKQVPALPTHLTGPPYSTGDVSDPEAGGSALRDKPSHTGISYTPRTSPGHSTATSRPSPCGSPKYVIVEPCPPPGLRSNSHAELWPDHSPFAQTQKPDGEVTTALPLPSLPIMSRTQDPITSFRHLLDRLGPRTPPPQSGRPYIFPLVNNTFSSSPLEPDDADDVKPPRMSPDSPITTSQPDNTVPGPSTPPAIPRTPVPASSQSATSLYIVSPTYSPISSIEATDPIADEGYDARSERSIATTASRSPSYSPGATNSATPSRVATEPIAGDEEPVGESSTQAAASAPASTPTPLTKPSTIVITVTNGGSSTSITVQPGEAPSAPAPTTEYAVTVSPSPTPAASVGSGSDGGYRKRKRDVRDVRDADE